MDDAHAIAHARGMQETVHSQVMDIESPMIRYDLIPDDEFIARLPEIVHAACFLSYCAAKAGRINPVEVLCDTGVVHELIHMLHECPKSAESISTVRGLIKDLQDRTVGFYPV